MLQKCRFSVFPPRQVTENTMQKSRLKKSFSGTRYQHLGPNRPYICKQSTQFNEVFGTGIYVPNVPERPVPVIPAVCLGTYRTQHTLASSFLLSHNMDGMVNMHCN